MSDRDLNPSHTTITIGDSANSLIKKEPYNYNKQCMKDVKRLGYSSPTLRIDCKEPPPLSSGSKKVGNKSSALKLNFPVFLKSVLDSVFHNH
jgi:hypothetical protein